MRIALALSLLSLTVFGQGCLSFLFLKHSRQKFIAGTVVTGALSTPFLVSAAGVGAWASSAATSGESDYSVRDKQKGATLLLVPGLVLGFASMVLGITGNIFTPEIEAPAPSQPLSAPSDLFPSMPCGDRCRKTDVPAFALLSPSVLDMGFFRTRLPVSTTCGKDPP